MNARSARLPAARHLLAPLSALYTLGVSLRNLRYDRRPAASHRVELPVISIGNLTVGGTGKTPIVIETVRRLHALGRRPAILTRGYAAAAGALPDEVLEYAQALPDTPVVVNPDRVAGAQTARSEHAADSLVLDDGFQHRRLRRDLDVVVIDALDPWGGGWVLPAGRLREPLRSLHRAHLLVISRANQVAAPYVAEIERVLGERAPDAPRLHATLEPEAAVFPDERVEPPGVLAYHSVLPVCGIGNPETFLTCVAQLAGRVCGKLIFSDHQRYAPRHVGSIADVAERRGADLVVTTRKDWVKLASLWSQHAAPGAPQLARLEVQLEVQDADGVFDDRLRHVLEKRA
jgi:tetraacyldisaccharide 4'-kinase